MGLICVQVKEEATCICSCMYVIDGPYCLCLSEIISPVRDPLSLIYEFGEKRPKKCALKCTALNHSQMKQIRVHCIDRTSYYDDLTVLFVSVPLLCRNLDPGELRSLNMTLKLRFRLVSVLIQHFPKTLKRGVHFFLLIMYS